MARLFYSMLIFAISAQSFAYILFAYNFFGGVIVYPLGSPTDMNAMSGWFQLSAYNALLGVGGAVLIGLAALLLRQGTYAIYAMLLFAIGMFVPIVKNFILVIPNTIAALLPSATNPVPGQINPLQAVVALFVLFAGFMFVFELVIQRPVS